MTPEQKTKLKSLQAEWGMAIAEIYSSQTSDQKKFFTNIKDQKEKEITRIIDSIPELMQKTVYVLHLQVRSGEVNVFSSEELALQYLDSLDLDQVTKNHLAIREANIIDRISEIKE